METGNFIECRKGDLGICNSNCCCSGEFDSVHILGGKERT